MLYEQGAHSGPDNSSITTISSTLKTAAVRAICPAMAVASSGDCALSMAAADTAMATVRCCGLMLVPVDPAALQRDRGALNMCSTSDGLIGRFRDLAQACHAALSPAPCDCWCCLLWVSSPLLDSPIGVTFPISLRALLIDCKVLPLLRLLPHMLKLLLVGRSVLLRRKQWRPQ